MVELSYMEIIDKLIKSLESFKAELEKATVAPNSQTVVGVPEAKTKELKIKNIQKQVDSGTYKPDPKKIADKMIKEELTCSENGQWNIIEKSIYNAGTHPMKGRETRVGNFPHYDYDTSVSHEENVKQAQAHFDKHKVKLNDTQFNTHLKQAKAKAEQD